MGFETSATFSAKVLGLMAVTNRTEATLEAVRWAKQYRRGRVWLYDLSGAAGDQAFEALADSPRALSRSLVRWLLEGHQSMDRLPPEPAIPGLEVIELPGLEWVDPPFADGAPPGPAEALR